MKRFTGFLILLAVAAVVLVWQLNRGGDGDHGGRGPGGGDAPPGKLLKLTGKAGGEKIGLLRDPEILKILADKYHIDLEVRKAGSVEMVKEPTAGLNYLWPASSYPVEYFKQQGGKYARAEDMFTSPIVIYSWAEVADALEAKGFVKKDERQGHYTLDLKKLVEEMTTEKAEGSGKYLSWADLGLKNFGSVLVVSTDPAKSNSGNMWAGLLANMLDGGQVVTPKDEKKVFPKVHEYFDRLGFLENSSGTLFDKFLSMGSGAYPLTVGYENQLIEFSHEQPALVDAVQEKIRVLYPQPTVWSTHPLIALDGDAVKLVEAMRDPEILRLAWEKHGFRSAAVGATTDTDAVKVFTAPQSIQNVMNTPSASVMLKLTDELGSPAP